ncbi:MAG: transposase [Pirellulales bacterium]|nr:transposase [Pirellulales bacterium]
MTTKLRAKADQLPESLIATFMAVIDGIELLQKQVEQLDNDLAQIARQHDIATRLMSIPGVGVITATALIASVSDIHLFKRGRRFSAWLGITPREHSSGNTQRLGRISKTRQQLSKNDDHSRCQVAHAASTSTTAG